MQPTLFLQFIDEIERLGIGEIKGEHDDIHRGLPQFFEGFLASTDRFNLQAGSGDHLNESIALGLVGMDEKQLAGLLLDEVADLLKRLVENLFRLDRLGENADRADADAAIVFIIGRDDLDRNMPRGDFILEAIENAPAVHIGEIDVQGDRGGMKFPRHGHGGSAAHGDDRLKAVLVRHIHQEPREVVVILDNQQETVAGHDVVGIIIDKVIRIRQGLSCCGR